MRFPGVVPVALVAAMAAATATAAAGCGSSSRSASRAERARADTAPLWALAPAGARTAIVVADGAGVEVLATLGAWLDAVAAHPLGAPVVEQVRARASAMPFDLLSAEAWRGAGLDPARGFAFFLVPADEDHDEAHVAIMPVVDRARFRARFELREAEESGVALDVLGDGEVACRELKQRYVCAMGVERVLALGAPSPLAALAAQTPAWVRGDVELLVVPPAGAELGPEIHMPTVVMAALRLEHDGAEWRVFTDAHFRGAAGAVSDAPPPGDWAALTAGATGVLRGRTPAASFAALAGTIGGPAGALLAELDGEVLGVTRGTGLVAGALWLGVRDARAAGTALEALCVQARGALPDLTWDATRRECAYAPQVPGLGALALGARVDGKRLVVDLGGGATPPAKGVPVARRAGSPAVAALLAAPAISVMWASGLDLWARLPASLRTAAAGLAGGDVIGVVDLISYLAAHVYDVTFVVSWNAEGGRVTLRATTFAGDPPAARAAHQGALALRARGELDAYKQALGDGGRAHPGTLLARQADVMLGDGPVLGGPLALLGGAAAAVAIPAFQKYQAKSTTTEAVWGVKKIYDGARSHYLESGRTDGEFTENRFPPSSSGPTPPLGTCCAQGGMCAPDPAIWDTPTWNELRFSMDDPHRYSYEFVSDGATFTARALGDLDCDGEYSTFEIVGAVDEGGDITGSAGIYKEKELE